MPLDTPGPIPADLLPDPDRLREAIAQHSERVNTLRRLLRLVLKLRQSSPSPAAGKEVSHASN
jgi:hypothetical protein